MVRQTKIILVILSILNFVLIINTQYIPLCESLNGIDNNEHNQINEEIKSRRVRALCHAIYSSRGQMNNDDLDKIPDFDLNRINSDDDANQILKRFRRSRFSGSSSRSSSSGSRSSSSGSRFLSGSRSSSGGSSRIFGGSSSSSSGSRIFSRNSGSSSSSSSGTTGTRTGIFSRSSSSSSGTGGHRVRQAVRSIIRKPSSSGSGVAGTSGGLSGTGGSKPGITDKIRKITHGGGGAGGIGSYGSGSNRYSPGMSGGGFGMGGSGGSGSSSWVRAGKKFLPVAVRFGKRYYQRRKYSKGMYAGMGAGAGYYAGSRMGGHQRNYYPDNYYGYPPVVDNPPEEIDGKAPTVFYCIQEDLNTTLVNKTLNSEGFGVCNISGELVTCPIEIECKTSEADTCCEDEQGAPMCCGGPIPDEYASQYGGYGDDLYDTAESFNKMLNIITAMSALLATICFTMWRREE